MTRRATRSGVNEGIQAANVRADVLAVGRHARAVKKTGPNDGAELGTAVRELRHAIDALALDRATRESLDSDLARLDDLRKEPAPSPAAQDTLATLASKLKAAGVVLSETASLAAPIKTIATLLQLAVTQIFP